MGLSRGPVALELFSTITQVMTSAPISPLTKGHMTDNYSMETGQSGPRIKDQIRVKKLREKILRCLIFKDILDIQNHSKSFRIPLSIMFKLILLSLCVYNILSAPITVSNSIFFFAWPGTIRFFTHGAPMPRTVYEFQELQILRQFKH